jgi:hypothetical protein
MATKEFRMAIDKARRQVMLEGWGKFRGRNADLLIALAEFFEEAGTPHLTLTSRPWVRASFASSLRSELGGCWL